MAPTRRKPTNRKNVEESIGVVADALSVDAPRAQADEVEADAVGAAGVNAAAAPAAEPFASKKPRPSVAGKKRVVRAVPAVDDHFAPHANPAGRTCDGNPNLSDEPIASDGSSEQQEPKAPSPRALGRGFRALRAALIAVLALLIVLEGGFCLFRWAVDDAADMQGTWYVNGSTSTIAITDEYIVLAEDVSYGYSLNEGAKTMTYTFGIMEGAGRYRFSVDRSQLAIMDGDFTFAETLMADISWTFEALIAQLSGEPLAPGSGEGVALLTRASEDAIEQPADGEDPSAEEPDGAVAGDETADEEPSANEAPDDKSGSADGASRTDASAPASDGRLTVTDKLVVSDKSQDA